MIRRRARRLRPDVPCFSFALGGSHPSKPPNPLTPPTTPRELRGRESPGEVLRSLIESPLAVPEEVFAALPRPCSTYSTAAPSSPCFIRHRRRKARHPLAEPRGSLRGAAAPVLDLFDRCAFLALLYPPRWRKARHPLAVPEEVFAALPRPRSTYSTAAPSSPCFIRPRRRKARHPPNPLSPPADQRSEGQRG